MSQVDRLEFIRFALDAGVLRFGEFKTKAGRLSPYFFNAGLFHDGALLGRLAEFYATALLEAERAGTVSFDMLFGPAYKGITLASATAVALAHHGRNVGFAYNRKEAKDHGEGGVLVGAPMRGRVAIIDDVISAGTSVNESVAIIGGAGATPCGVVISLDRQERGQSALSAAQEVRERHGLPVFSIVALEHVVEYLAERGDRPRELAAIAAYRGEYGA